MKKINFKVNTTAEKAIISTTLSVVLAIIFDEKRKKPDKRKNFFQRAKKSYKLIDGAMSATVARDALSTQKQIIDKLHKSQYKTKLRNLEIEQAIPFDLNLKVNEND